MKYCDPERHGDQILNLLMERGPLRAAEIRKQLRLSQNCLTYATRWLKEQNLIRIDFFRGGPAPMERPSKHYFLTTFIGEGVDIEAILAEERRKFRCCENCIHLQRGQKFFNWKPCKACLRNPKLQDAFELKKKLG